MAHQEDGFVCDGTCRENFHGATYVTEVCKVRLGVNTYPLIYANDFYTSVYLEFHILLLENTPLRAKSKLKSRAILYL